MVTRRVIGRMVSRVGLTHAARALVSPAYRREMQLVRELIGRIDSAEFAVLRDRFAGTGDSIGPSKYLALEPHLWEMVRQAGKLAMLDAPPQRVLDLGCGTGAFLFVLKSVGHEVLGLDLPAEPIYDEMTRFLGIPRVLHRIEPFERLPAFDKAFDLISAFSICFDGHQSEQVWGREEWAFFIDDCLSRLRPNGRLALLFNPATTHDFDFLPDDVAAFMRSIPGAKLSANKEFLCVESGPR